MYYEIIWDETKIKKFWNYEGSKPEASQVYFGAMFGDAVLKYATGRVPLNGVVLDCGCGPGYFSEKLLARHATVVAVEGSEESVNMVKQRLGGQRNLVDVRQGDVTRLPCEDQFADAVFLLEVLEHLDNSARMQALSEIFRVLKPCGKLLVSVPYDEDLVRGKVACPACGCVFHRVQHQASFNKESLEAQLSDSGFCVEEIRALNWSDLLGNPLIRGLRKMRRLLRRENRFPHLVAVARRPNN
ncbi:class I SAM-dependent methyltransferase [Methylocaldum sp. RMAD-M]|jgi:SAM-dependent methyltransferase|uniref:class I SAM-dependent methyltransferase n=1 Tax=Methylocaldum sp. RMAD-M TaxID=2806557 RepID=UPI000A3221CC|nr:class I SAM-dependent methyltransferase [Methylocaldum sp. RMAD-M]MBP1152814.1 SAM-dependent methyltransferase [Methylocaldum sp. RMAD-M]